VLLDVSRDPWPWADDSVDGAQAWHVMEHLGPGPEPFFHFLKELYRVCRNGAIIGVIVPHPRHDVFLNDPTHVRAVTPDGMAMFSRSHCAAMAAKGAILTPLWEYLGVDFEIQSPIRMVLDPAVNPDSDWREREKRESNIVIEYRFTLKVVK